MFRADYHMHSEFSFDGKAKHTEMIEVAIKKGMDEIVFTDHFDFFKNEDLQPKQLDFLDYFNTITEAADKYASKIKIKCGIEAGVYENSNQKLKQMLKIADFDFIIASIHNVNDVDIYFPDFYDFKPKRRAYMEYFTALYESVLEVEDFCVIGHLDYISRYALYEDRAVKFDEYFEILDKILKAAAKKGKGLEINTSGFKYKLNDVYPQLLILKHFKAVGGEVLTLGSDAHHPDFISDHFDYAIEIAKEAGFRHLCKFEKRKPLFYDIE